MTAPDARARGLTLVGASAGSGKTHRLTEEVTRAVDPSRGAAIAPEALVAVTFTRRAAGELGARIRRTLVESGAYESAQRLPLAHLGTVHGVCLRFVQEFAIDAGLSPHVDVLSGDASRLLREALEGGLELALRERLYTLAERFQLRVDSRRDRVDPLTPVQNIMDLARNNRIDPAALPAMAERSAAGLIALLGPAAPDGDALDAELVASMEASLGALDRIADPHRATADARALIAKTLGAAKSGRLLWCDWIRLQKLNPAKPAKGAVAPVIDAATRVDAHPRMRAELRDLTLALYETAQRGLEAYDGWKKKRRVVDFVDMVDRALTLMHDPDVAAELGARLGLVVVDELQDTSPLQLALFVRLHALARRSIWVGDRKQCIFEFAGADPSLMEAVTAWVGAEGGDAEQLPTNWRSRPELVDACSRLFAGAFASQGYRRAEVEVNAKRATPPELAALPPFGVWWLETTRNADDAEALAEGVRRLVASPAATRVVDRTTKLVRDLAPHDVAVLVATNLELEALAAALARRGVRVSVARAGLLATPEGTLAAAALRFLLDARDSLACAEIEALTGFDGQEPERWLDARLATTAARRAARDRGEEAHAEPPSTTLAPLDALRGEVDALSPSEALDRALAALDLASIAARWPDPQQRLANLDALRALTGEYEARCALQREAATIAGLLRYFEEAQQPLMVRDEERASDEQHLGGGEQAVTVATYHRAKGLEWPVVVLGSLDKGDKRDAFEVSPESDRAAFDPSDPLGGRWIRYWPWPFGQSTKARLSERAALSKEGRAVAEREQRERVRLLYVGFTRARDHLVLAVRKQASKVKKEWLDELCDEEGRALIDLPPAFDATTERAELRVRGPEGGELRVSARHWSLTTGGDAPERLARLDSHAWFAGPEPSHPRPPYRIAPSRAVSVSATALADRVIGAPQPIGERLPLGRAKVDWDLVGNAVHAFFAADLPGLAPEQRLGRARRLLDASELLGVLGPEALVRASDQLRAWIDSRWPAATWHREYPVSAVVATPHGSCRVEGTIDLLLETPEGVVILDHKSYPGPPSTWEAKAGEYGPQLDAYAQVLTSSGKRVLGKWISFAIGGGVVELA